jgi:hypothetical protein
MAKPDYVTLFESQNAGFVDALRTAADSAQLAAFAGRWMADGRAWAHEQMFRYLDLPWDCAGHQPIIKRLFKWAEQQHNDELMAAFATGCDRLVRRERRKCWKYDWKTRTSWEETVLIARRDVLHPGMKSRNDRNPLTGERLPNVSLKKPSRGRLFSYHTRYYLRRRAWRYFRWLGYQRPSDYPLAIARALILYRDKDLEQGENLLDSWTLMQACFGEHSALEFGTSLIKILPGRALGELSPAPRFLELWQKADSCEVLLLMVLEARSRPMRVWAIEMLKAHHAPHVKTIPSGDLLELLTNPHEEVNQFAAELLEQAEGLETWPLSTWLTLLRTQNLTALETICRVMAQKVSGERLTLAECLQLTIAEPTPVARMGFGYLQSRPLTTPEDRRSLTVLGEAECNAVAAAITAWALPILGHADLYHRDNVLPFFDSLSLPIRKSAWDWLLQPSEPTNSAAFDDPVFWCRLLETPFDDVRQQLIDVLDRRSARTFPRPGTESLTPVWCGVLAGVHRGGRQKLKAIQQMTIALEKQPARADSLLPVLSIALRSLRAPEMREALAAVAHLSESLPELAAAINKHLPEVNVQPIGETVW